MSGDDRHFRRATGKSDDDGPPAVLARNRRHARPARRMDDDARSAGAGRRRIALNQTFSALRNGTLAFARSKFCSTKKFFTPPTFAAWNVLTQSMLPWPIGF